MIVRTHGFWFGLACLGLTTACMPSQHAHLNATPQTHDEWIKACEGGERDPIARARYCDLVAKSDLTSENDYLWAIQSAGNAYYEQGAYAAALSAYQEAVDNGAGGDAYGNLAYAHEKLGNFDAAIENYEIAFRETRDGDYMNELGVLEEGMTAASYYYFNFQGFTCKSVQKDSVLHPANEVIVQVVTQDVLGEIAAIQLPKNNEYYSNVKAGFNNNRTVSERVFFAEAFAPATMTVVMWEHDDGGPLIDAAVMYAPLFAAGRAANATGARTPHNIKMRMPPAQSTGASPKPTGVLNIVSQAAKSALGTSHDFMGSDSVQQIVAAELKEAGTKSENGFTYHFKTHHRRSGANCTAYFYVDAHSGPDWEQRVIDYVDAAIDK